MAERARGYDEQGRRTPQEPITTGELVAAVNAFYRRRWQEEMELFFPTPWRDEPPPADETGFPLLLRVGRFSHFESASLDKLRQGWQPQGKRAIREGSTRAVIEQESGRTPFGWLALVPRGQEEELNKWAPPLLGTASSSTPSPAPSGRTVTPRGLNAQFWQH